MKNFILIALTSLNFFSTAQVRKIDSYIKKINNSQFVITHKHKSDFFTKSNAADKLIEIGKPATEKLILALNDSTKTIMAHLILCHIYFKYASFAGPKITVSNGEDVNKYFLGEEKGEGLIISESKINMTYKVYILPHDKSTVIEYWKSKVGY